MKSGTCTHLNQTTSIAYMEPVEMEGGCHRINGWHAHSDKVTGVMGDITGFHSLPISPVTTGSNHLETGEWCFSCLH